MNAHIGEKSIKILDKEYLCRPDFKALCEIESLANSSIIDIFERFAQQKTRFTDIVIILYSCHKSGMPESKLSYQEFGEIVKSHGVYKLINPAYSLVADALVGDTDKKKDEAEEAQEDKTQPVTQ